MFAIILTLALTNQSSSTVQFGGYDSLKRCNEVITEVKKSYVGSEVRTVTARCVPVK